MTQTHRTAGSEAIHSEGGRDGHGQAVQRLFDAKASAWSAKYAPGGALVGRLARLSGSVGRYVRAGDRVLDLGCGTGELARALAEEGIRSTGCDISGQMLRRAAACSQDGCLGWVQLGAGLAAALPFASGVFDTVIAASAPEYVADPRAVLGECARVLRPGGVMLCTRCQICGTPCGGREWLARASSGSRGAGPIVALARIPFRPAHIPAAASPPMVARCVGISRAATCTVLGRRQTIPTQAPSVPTC